MADEFEDIGDIVPFRKPNKKDINPEDYDIPIKNYKANSMSNDLTPDDTPRVKEYIKEYRKLEKLENSSSDSNIEVDKDNKELCDITGDIVSYKRPSGLPPLPGVPGESGVPPSPGTPPTELSIISRLLEEHHLMLQTIASIENDLKEFLMGNSPTGTYVEVRTSTTVATPDQPTTQDTTADAGAVPPTPGYDFIDINKQKQGYNAQNLWIVNDGPDNPTSGDNLFVISSTDGKTFSPEFLMIVGETRLIHNIYEVRIRSPRENNRVRITEREPNVPYVTTVTNSLTPVANRTSVWTQRVGVPFGMGAAIPLPFILVPDAFSIVVRASVDNIGTSRVYIGGPEPLPGPNTTNAETPGNRITLAPGDDVRYTISNANVLAIVGNMNGLFVDITVER